METLIEDLLTLARDDQRILETDTVDLWDTVEECWATVETGETTLVGETDQTIRADESRLKQLLENLIRNAVQHGGRDVTVTVGELSEGFYVADDGVGIPADLHDDIFELGYSTEDWGSGLGLEIVTGIVDSHGWEITVTDSDTGGARFEITDVEIVE